MFEKVNKAYEFLCTKTARIVDGPDPENIILILKAQSILFNRHKQGLFLLLFILSPVKHSLAVCKKREWEFLQLQSFS